MNAWDIARSVGGRVVRDVVPGGDAIIDAVNQLLPDNKQLGQVSTGLDVVDAVDSLPPESRARLMQRQFDVDIKGHETMQVMLASDATQKHTTRPRIALGAFQVLTFVTILVVSMWAHGVVSDNDEMVSVVMDGWPMVLAVIGPFVSLLYAYFGLLRSERRDMLGAITETRNSKQGY